MKRILLTAGALLLTGSLALAYAPNYAPNLDNGKALFESPSLGGGTSGKSCSSCHAGGKKLKANIVDMDQERLADMVNVCIEKPLGGHAIDTRGEDMQDLIAYLRSLATKNK